MEQLTTADILYLEQRGISASMVEKQFLMLVQGIAPVQLTAGASVHNGIWRLAENQLEKYAEFYRHNKEQYNIVKFVPASGAATRMFKELFDFRENFSPNEQTFEQYVTENKAHWVKKFFSNLEKFAFYPSLDPYLEQISVLNSDEQKLQIADFLLRKKYLNYGNCPKGLFPFHLCGNEQVTAFQEHLTEGVLYASNSEVVRLHFTISPFHTQKFQTELNRILPKFQQKYKLNFEVTFSHQLPSTDTISLVNNSEIFRDETQNIVLRPAGHGALLKNLNQINADIIFIKNIDNVATEKWQQETARYKEILAGVLLETAQKIKEILQRIETNEIRQEEISEILEFLKKINVPLEEEMLEFNLQKMLPILFEKLNRPIRVCGMVKNEGDVGGGPFWVQNKNQTQSLQIIELSQINQTDPEQQKILQQATHFNPVDLVCFVKDYKGNKFDLEHFSDASQGFISEKTQGAKKIKTLELSGLWNGSMAGWISVFVEVPLTTFNPVKSVNDLLKEAHLPC